MGTPPMSIATAEDVAALRQDIQRLTDLLTGATVIPPPEWHPVSEAARILGVDRTTVHRKIARGELVARGAGKTREVKVPYSSRLARSSAVSS